MNKQQDTITSDQVWKGTNWTFVNKNMTCWNKNVNKEVKYIKYSLRELVDLKKFYRIRHRQGNEIHEKKKLRLRSCRMKRSNISSRAQRGEKRDGGEAVFWE